MLKTDRLCEEPAGDAATFDASACKTTVKGCRASACTADGSQRQVKET
jgi:hypothetical protein